MVKLENLTTLSFANTQPDQVGEFDTALFSDTWIAGTTGDLVKLSNLMVLDFANRQVTESQEDLATLPLTTLRYDGTPARQADLASMTGYLNQNTS